MATTPKTVRTYPINSVARDFTIPFEYLARKFVVVTLIGATRRELILNTDYRFTTATMITTTKAWGPSDNFTLIEIRRLTSATERLVDFADGSILRAYDLNTSQVQSLHIAEEARDLTADTIGVNNDGQLDARARRIVNVADAIDDGDAVNLRMQRTWAATALNYSQAASQSAAVAAQNNSQSLTNNQQSYQNLVLAQQQAAASAASAGQSANSAAASQASRVASEQARTDASQWASRGEDQIVSGSWYSSLHYAMKSARSATASQNSANASANSANSAAGSVSAAQAQADRAKAEADKLANFNGLAGAIDGISGVNVFWKGNVFSQPGAGNSTGFYARNDVEANFGFAKADGTDIIRLVRTGDRGVQIYDDQIGSRVTFGVQSSRFPKALQVDGVLSNLGGFSGTSGSFSGQVNVGSLRSASEVVGVTQVVVKAPANAPSNNVHMWWRNADDTERALIYADSGNTMHLRTASGAGSGEGLTINGANFPTAYGLNVSHRPDYQTTFFKSGVGAGASMYGNCQLQLQAADGSIPALGFHSAGRYAAALWLNTDNNFYIMKNSGQNELLISNVTLMGQIAGNMTADVPGTIATMQNISGTNLGLNSTLGGGSLRFATHNNVSTQGGTGSWRCTTWSNNGGVSTWVRYA